MILWGLFWGFFSALALNLTIADWQFWVGLLGGMLVLLPIYLSRR